MKRYTAELLRVNNKKSRKVTYFAKVCNNFVRISEKDYTIKKSLADGVENVTIILQGNLVRHFTTQVYYI